MQLVCNLRATVWQMLAMHLLAHACWATVGGSVSLPLPGIVQKRTSGLRMEVASYWVESPGYRPLIVTVSSLVPITADRYLDVTIIPKDWYRTRQGVQFQLKIPQGATSVRQEIAAPQLCTWQSFDITTYENGQELSDLSGDIGLARTMSSSWTEAYPSMLFIDADAPQPGRTNAILASGVAGDSQLLPDILAVAPLIAPLDDFAQNVWRNQVDPQVESQSRERTDDRNILSTVQRLQTVALLPPDELPTQWLNYTCLDLIFISIGDLRALSQRRPEVWTAIRRYVMAGGNLVVLGAGEGFAAIPELDALLDVPSLAGDADAAPDNESNVWQAPNAAAHGMTLAELSTPKDMVQTFSRNRVVIEEAESEDGDTFERRPLPLTENVFRWRSVGWGRVLVAISDELNDVSSDQWAWVLNDVGSDRWRWYRRHGLSRQRPNRAFWEFLIPGVGAAPVRTFLAVITAFVFIIGPVNYFLLQRSRRLYLLLVTVPVGSALIIGSLFGLALVKDGLGTRARLRSFSKVLPDGRAVSWSRQSYYAGLAPSSGLIYPTGAAVYSIDFDPDRQIRARRITRWGDTQQLAPGYLQARSTSQTLVIHQSSIQPPVKIERLGADALQVTNLGPMPLDHLWIQDQSQSFWIRDLAPQKTSRRIAQSAGCQRPLSTAAA